MEKKKPYVKAELEIYDFGEEKVYADPIDSDNFVNESGKFDFGE